MEGLGPYIPMDRRQAMVYGRSLPDRTHGAALFADVSGFTPLTEALLRELGPRRGADELTWQLNRVFDALIAKVHHYGGSVLMFAGDAITCWFDGDDGSRAVACGLSMQEAMLQFATIETPGGAEVSLAMKAAVASGPVRRFRIGDPHIQYLDVLAGATLHRVVAGEHLAERGEVLVSPEAIADLGDWMDVVERRPDQETGDLYSVVARLLEQAQVDAKPWPDLFPDALTEEQMRPWALPPVYERLKAGQSRYLAEIRPAVALFLKFGGLDYDKDDDAGAKLDQYVRWVQGVLARYEGYMLQQINGDKGSYLYAAFGAPLAHEDDPCRAVRAAVELLSPPPELDFVGKVQIGISQGRMRTGDYGGTARRTYGTLGDEVNVAARLMGVAAPGQILVTQQIAQAAASRNEFECIGQISVKGKQDPLTVSRVLGIRQTPPPRSIAFFSHPLVGRDRELALMEKVLESTLSGRGQVLRLEGEAGLGKSHLAAEFVERAICRGFRAVSGICQSTGQSVPYYPWREVFRALFDLGEEPEAGEDPLAWSARQIAQVEARVNDTNPAWFSRLPLLGDVLGLPIPDTPATAAFDPKVRQQALFALAVEIVQTWAAEKPLLVLLEDVRWMDEASQDLTTVLGRNFDQSPVLLVVVHRPPIREDRPLLPGLGELPYHHHLDLSELSPEGMAALVTNRLEGHPSALTLSLVQAKAQGNPFFIEELVDTLRESGALYRTDKGMWLISRPIVDVLREAHCLTRADNGEWELIPDAPLATVDLGIPDSIHGVVLSRIDRLPEDHKMSLKVASVIGRVFEFDLLAQSHPIHLSHETLRAQVREMEARDFTRLELPPPQLSYMFKHNITQEVVYGTLLHDQERELHEAIGESLERIQPEAVERLAYHFYEGHAWDKALTYKLRVGRTAQRGFANDIAAEAYGHALEATAHVEGDTTGEQVVAHEALGEVLTLVGQYDPALEHYAAARSLVSDRDSLHLADLCRKTADVYERRSDYQTAFEWLEKGLGCLDEAEPTIEVARIHILQAGVYYRQGRFEESIARCQQCLTLASQIQTREGEQVVARANYLLGLIYKDHGDLQRAIQYGRRSVEVYEGIDDIAGLSRAYNNLGTTYQAQGDWVHAGDAYQRSLEINREIGETQQQGFVTNNLGNLHLYRGEWDEAAAFYTESNTIWGRLGAALPDAVTLSNLAQVHIYRENWSEAHDCLTRSEAILTEIGADTYLPELERRWAELYLGTGALDEALDHIHRSIELAMVREARLEEGMSLRVLGEIRLAQGKGRFTEAILRQSLTILNALNSEYEAAKTIPVLVRAAPEQDQPDVQAQLARAIETFERLGAQADLAEAMLLVH